MEKFKKNKNKKETTQKGDYMKISKYSETRISVSEAAEMLSMNKDVLKELMKTGKLPIGIVAKSKKSETNHTYYIYKDRITAYLKGYDLMGFSDKKFKESQENSKFKKLKYELLKLLDDLDNIETENNIYD